MMWLVRVALERPYTFIVMSLLIAVLGVGSILTMPTDIFPSIDKPNTRIEDTANDVLIRFSNANPAAGARRSRKSKALEKAA